MNIRYYSNSWKLWEFGFVIGEPMNFFRSKWEFHLKFGPLGEVIFWAPVEEDR